MAAANYSTTGSLASLIKVLYPQGEVEKLVQTDFPFLGMIPKMNNWQGSPVHNPFCYSTGGGASSDWATALAHSTPSQNTNISLTSKPGYVFADVTRESMLAMQGPGAQSFVDAKKFEIDMKLAEASALLSQELWSLGDGTGQLATIKAGTSTASTTIYLTNRVDALKFQKGDKIGVSASDGGTLRGTPSYATVTGRSFSAGTLTFDTALATTISGAAAGDYVYKKGNINSFLKGVPSWIPDTAPTSGDSFYGMDRSQDSETLAGLRINGAGSGASRALTDLLVEISALSNKKPDIVLVNDLHWPDLSEELGSYERFDPSKMDRNTGPRTIRFSYHRGNALIVTDNYVPLNHAYAIKLDTWKLYGRGPSSPHIQSRVEDIIKSTTFDGYQIPISFYCGLVCMQPWANGVCTNFMS